MKGIKESVKEWYAQAYPSDDLGKEINGAVTFEDLFTALDTYQDVYEVLGVFDSIVRERVFAELAERMSVDYNYVYDQWVSY